LNTKERRRREASPRRLRIQEKEPTSRGIPLAVANTKESTNALAVGELSTKKPTLRGISLSVGRKTTRRAKALLITEKKKK
jgi:hypothetical protein